jgi:two-component system sensor kinase FixL
MLRAPSLGNRRTACGIPRGAVMLAIRQATGADMYRSRARTATRIALMSDAKNPPAAASMMLPVVEIARASVLEEMMSGIAHELNQPLGAITTYAQAGERMLNRPEPMVAEALQVFRQISTEAMGAGADIQTIRRLFNRDVSNVRRRSCGELIYEVFPLLLSVAERAGGDLSLGIQPDLPEVMVDSLRVQHVVLTLVQNAFEAAERGSPVEIEVAGDRYGVEISVLDHGGGIPEQARTQIFKPFHTTKAHGTGLGLASSRAIVEAHEGSIGFENVPRGGTRFWFRLPAAV